ncbi:MAG: phosphatidylserine decarboxylase family protein [Saprospiraceae bacterium]|nr:phosphatidylserine decarboxylase family protein [Saprospiraceae bacterium]MCB9320894.1 phosphatidylserine decarboxylase family protein [Lewinellaceae bacterium]
MIHREGYIFLTICILILAALSWAGSMYLGYWAWMLYILSIGLTLFLLYFFRNPDRHISAVSEDLVYAPADGKVVVIEETTDTEYLKDRRIQVSIFMSPLNVHVNRNPVSGSVLYQQYHPGKFMPAWNPKSSLENERTTIVYETPRGKVGMRQIAGALARRIVCYLKQGQKVRQGDDMGFIKLGSRVDLLLPVGTEIKVKIGDVVKGNITVIGKL